MAPSSTDDLMEWDYGDYEGRRTVDIQKERPGWLIWSDGVPGGETVDQVGERARRVIARALAADGDVALFAHGHILRILTARWLGLPPVDGRVLHARHRDGQRPRLRARLPGDRAMEPEQPSGRGLRCRSMSLTDAGGGRAEGAARIAAAARDGDCRRGTASRLRSAAATRRGSCWRRWRRRICPGPRSSSSRSTSGSPPTTVPTAT